MGVTAEHWDEVYRGGDRGRSWYQSQAAISIQLIEHHQPQRSSAIVDVGGGASVLVDDLLSAGYTDLTVMDISMTGLEIARQRVAGVLPDAAAQRINWIVADVTRWQPDQTYDVWHDRAVLHFMTDDDSLGAYRRSMVHATSPGALVILGVFGPEGPQRCSGLPVKRWSRADTTTFLGDEFTLIDAAIHVHVTPSGAEQQFAWTIARRR